MVAMIPISCTEVTKLMPTHASHVITSLILLNYEHTIRASFKLIISFQDPNHRIVTFHCLFVFRI